MLAINIEKKDKIMHEAGCIARFRTVCADEYFMRDCLSFELPQIFFGGNAGRYAGVLALY